MKQEMLLLAAIVLVWSILAAVYAFAPDLGMPGYVRVWGGGAVIFTLLIVTLVARRRAR